MSILYYLHVYREAYQLAGESRRRRASALFAHPVAGPVAAFRVSPPSERVIDVPFLVVREVRATLPPFSPEVVE